MVARPTGSPKSLRKVAWLKGPPGRDSRSISAYLGKIAVDCSECACAKRFVAGTIAARLAANMQIADLRFIFVSRVVMVVRVARVSIWGIRIGEAIEQGLEANQPGAISAFAAVKGLRAEPLVDLAARQV